MEFSRSERIVIGISGVAAILGLAAMTNPDKKDQAVEILESNNPFDDSQETIPTPNTTAEKQSDCTEINSISLHNRIGATILIIGEATQLDQIRDTMQRNAITGFALSDSTSSIADLVNYRGQSTDFATATNDIISSVETEVGPVTFAIDQEGGTVQRLEPLSLFDSFPSAQEQAQINDPKLLSMIQTEAQKLSIIGVNMVFGPVLDVGQQGFIGSRSYGNDPTTVYDKAGIFIEGLRTVNIDAVAKHYPDHGYVQTDSHNSAGLSLDLETLSTKGALPAYQKFFDENRLEFVMINHLSTEGLTESGQPASLSPKTYELLKSQGFNGVAMTDALAMDAVQSYVNGENSNDGQAKAAVQALSAGADIVLVNVEASDNVVKEISSALIDGRITEERINEAAAKVWENKDTPVDICGY